MSAMMQFLGSLLSVARTGDRRGVTSWWKHRYRAREAKRQKLPKNLRPWQLRQWLGRDIKTGVELWKPIVSLETRQRRRAALRKLCQEQITEKYSGEPRKFRRRIARRLAVKAFGDMKVAA